MTPTTPDRPNLLVGLYRLRMRLVAEGINDFSKGEGEMSLASNASFRSAAELDYDNRHPDDPAETMGAERAMYVGSRLPDLYEESGLAWADRVPGCVVVDEWYFLPDDAAKRCCGDHPWVVDVEEISFDDECDDPAITGRDDLDAAWDDWLEDAHDPARAAMLQSSHALDFKLAQAQIRWSGADRRPVDPCDVCQKRICDNCWPELGLAPTEQELLDTADDEPAACVTHHWHLEHVGDLASDGPIDRVYVCTACGAMENDPLVPGPGFGGYYRW